MPNKILKISKTRVKRTEPEIVQEEAVVVRRRRPILHTPATLAEAVGERAAILVGKSPTEPVANATKEATKKQVVKRSKNAVARPTATRTTVTRRKRAA